MTREFVENDEGVHIMGIDQGFEFTACGWACDAPSSERDFEYGPFRSTAKKTVTCPRCIAVVEHYRGVRVATK